jgi:hypothetical protein
MKAGRSRSHAKASARHGPAGPDACMVYGVSSTSDPPLGPHVIFCTFCRVVDGTEAYIISKCRRLTKGNKTRPRSHRHKQSQAEAPAATQLVGYPPHCVHCCPAARSLGMWVAVWGALDRFEPMALTSELSVRFVRPAIGHVLHAHVDISAISGRSIVSTATMWTDAKERPCSIAQGTYVIPRRSG